MVIIVLFNDESSIFHIEYSRTEGVLSTIVLAKKRPAEYENLCLKLSENTLETIHWTSYLGAKLQWNSPWEFVLSSILRIYEYPLFVWQRQSATTKREVDQRYIWTQEPLFETSWKYSSDNTCYKVSPRNTAMVLTLSVRFVKYITIWYEHRRLIDCGDLFDTTTNNQKSLIKKSLVLEFCCTYSGSALWFVNYIACEMN